MTINGGRPAAAGDVGRPAAAGDVGRPAAGELGPRAEKAALRREIATIDRDVTAPIAGFTLRPRDEVLLREGGAQGLKVYQDILRDPHAGAVLRKRRLAVVAREWSVEPASEEAADLAAAGLVKAALEGLPFDRLCYGLLGSILTGYAVAELVWGPRTVDGRQALLPVRAIVRGARRFVFDRERNLRLLTFEAPAEGVALPDRKFIVARFGEEETEDPYGLGLGHALFWPVFFKRQGIAFWLAFADRFGNPAVIGEYPPGATPEEQARLLAAIDALSHDAGMIMPQGMIVRLLEAARTGTVDTYDRLLATMDAGISECVLGETLTTNAGDQGSRALGEVHNDVREELTDADADLLSDTLNETIARWIVELNEPGAAPPRIWRNKADGEDLRARAERDKLLMDAGWEPEDPDYFERVYGERWVRRPAPPPPPAFGPEPPPPAFAEAAGGSVIDGWAARLAEAAGGELGALQDKE